ncbi:MAG: hypothetical protein AXA67_02135 [Methylothermaceae bacteria B42]|nr:MAG: hypothetical protein AXA67_02135 [Methylothermaceae bacteria B42]HHJ40061.1 hypothetical protein [Methylothermaceae bacterium]
MENNIHSIQLRRARNHAEAIVSRFDSLNHFIDWANRETGGRLYQLTALMRQREDEDGWWVFKAWLRSAEREKHLAATCILALSLTRIQRKSLNHG